MQHSKSMYTWGQQLSTLIKCMWKNLNMYLYLPISSVSTYGRHGSSNSGTRCIGGADGVAWGIAVPLTADGSGSVTAVFFRGPSPPSAGGTATHGCSWRVGRRCTWCAWNTAWPASSCYANRASPARCVRRGTWGSWTCPPCSALTSPPPSFPPSRYARYHKGTPTPNKAHPLPQKHTPTH